MAILSELKSRLFLFFHSAKVAENWCSRLTKSSELFSACHSEISPDIYYQVSIFAQNDKVNEI